jgi:TRAP-type mannitol/chloroaromatic compound transport system permease small subunit
MQHLGQRRQIAGRGTMQTMLKLSRMIDFISEKIGHLTEYLILICCLVSAAVATIRYTFSYSSNGWLEIQWYMFAAIVLLGAAHTLRMNEHVRVDLIYGAVSDRTRLWIDCIGLIIFLIPTCIFLTWLCWPFFFLSFQQGEISQNAGGLIRWPVKLILVLGFALLLLQGISELIKRIASLAGIISIETKYEKPLQ